MYTRKWTRMDYSESVRLMRKYNLIPNTDYYRALQLFPISDLDGTIANSPSEASPSPYRSSKINKEHLAEQKRLEEMVLKVIQRYPDLKYEPLSKASASNAELSQSYLVRFVEHQQRLIKQGFTKEKAFELTEKVYQDRITRKVEQQRVTENLAVTNQARSFMSHFQQQTEYEARLKVIRLSRDLKKYEQRMQVLENDMAQLSAEQDGFKSNKLEDEEDEEEGNDYSGVPGSKNDKEVYQRVLLKVMRESLPEEQEGDEQSEEQVKKTRTEKVDEFIERTQNMFSLYYTRAAINDRLSFLSDPRIIQSTINSPKKIEKRTRALCKKLDKLGVFLNEGGEVDYSAVKIENLLKRLKKDEDMIKYALQQKHMHFESPIAEAYREKALQFRRRLRELEQERKNLANVEGTAKDGQDEPQPDNNEYAQFKSQYDASIRNTNSNQSQDPQHNEVKNISASERNQLTGAFEEDETEENKLKESYNQQLEEDIDFERDSFRLFESYQERYARVEARLVEYKLRELEEEGATDSETRKKLLQEAVRRLRRIKYRIDQRSLKEAGKLLFEEHDVFDKDEEFLVDSDIPFEKLYSYLRSPVAQRRQTDISETADRNIDKLIRRKVIVEDTVEPFAQSALREQDVIQLRQQEEELKREAYLDKISQQKQLKQEDQDAKMEEMDDDDINQRNREEDKNQEQEPSADKSYYEKQKLLEFVQKANVKDKLKSKTGTMSQLKKQEKVQELEALAKAKKSKKKQK